MLPQVNSTESSLKSLLKKTWDNKTASATKDKKITIQTVELAYKIRNLKN